MATCESCGGYRWSEHRVSGLCRACWAVRENPRRRHSREESPCVICERPISKLEGLHHREMSWVFEFLGGKLCPRCMASISSFAKHVAPGWKSIGRETPLIGERIVLAWMCRLLGNSGRHKRNWGTKAPSLPKTEQHKQRIRDGVLKAKASGISRAEPQ